ncbi:SDR family oxidoreductase [Streptomyces anulatus]|uniref:SDR family oxidoreductase n=1 Tax=Streptomyces anulatus TaxID=1892 RepID=UPI003863EF90
MRQRRSHGPGRIRPGLPRRSGREPRECRTDHEGAGRPARPRGAVVHIGSIAADQGAGSYGAVKAGLVTWNLDLARELGPRGITANVVSPGYIADTEFFRDRLPDTRRTDLVSATATGRAGAPADIATTVAFLASPEARHITGQVLHVNGGAYGTR